MRSHLFVLAIGVVRSLEIMSFHTFQEISTDMLVRRVVCTVWDESPLAARQFARVV